MNDEIKVPTMQVTPLKKICTTIGELPTSYLETMSYYEMLVWFTNYLRDNIIPVVNNNGEATHELQVLFTELQSYVNNYFDNLDVQDEINNKLDKMLEDGVLEQIIEQYLSSSAIWGFDNVASMKEATNLIDGSFAKTLGFYSKNDGGSALYKIKNYDNEIIDNNKVIRINNNLVAIMINPSPVKTKLCINLWLDSTIEKIKSRIDAYLFMGVSKVIPIIHLSGDNCTISENTTIINEAISYARSKDIIVDTIKFHCTDNRLLTNTTYREYYKNNIRTFLNTQSNIENIIIFNELDSLFSSSNEEGTNYVITTINYFQSLNYKVSVSFSNFFTSLLKCIYTNTSIINQLDFIACNHYPVIGDNKELTSYKDVDGAMEDVFNCIKTIKELIPYKKIIWSETGVQNVWESLSHPSDWQIENMSGVTNSNGNIIPLYFNPLIYNDKLKYVDELWLWYTEYYDKYYDKLIDFRKLFVGGDK